MADGITTDTILIMAMLLSLAGLLAFELRFMKRRRKRKGAQGELPDQAHNALLSVKAIRDTLARGGVRSPEAEDAIREAEVAYTQLHYRVAIDVAAKAKGLLRTAKLRHQERGDLAKLDEIATSGPGGAEVTEKERLAKELPPNYMQAKFSLGLAREDIAAAKDRGQDTKEAEVRLDAAQASFDGKDFDGALKEAVRARRALEEGGTEPATAPVAPTAVVTKRVCASCGAAMTADDGFCRKCGVKVQGPPVCSACGTEIVEGDAFCRKCGAKAELAKP